MLQLGVNSFDIVGHISTRWYYKIDPSGLFVKGVITNTILMQSSSEKNKYL